MAARYPLDNVLTVTLDRLGCLLGVAQDICQLERVSQKGIYVFMPGVKSP